MSNDKMREALTWRVEYANECLPDGDGGSTYDSWWNATDGVRSFRADYQDDARMLADALNQSAALAQSDAQPVIPSGWKVESVPPWGALTDEANAANKWLVKRTEPPFCDDKGTRQWNGATIAEAMSSARDALGMQYASPQQAQPVPEPLSDEQIDAMWDDREPAWPPQHKVRWFAREVERVVIERMRGKA
jgi:hypothetical protein